MSGFMEEVMDTINRIFNNYLPYIAKANEEDIPKVRAIMDEILDNVIKETDPMTIARKMNLAELEIKK